MSRCAIARQSSEGSSGVEASRLRSTSRVNGTIALNSLSCQGASPCLKFRIRRPVVMRLRRGFLATGAAEPAHDLWPIGDESTVQIMSDFYQAPGQSPTAPNTLARILREGRRHMVSGCSRDSFLGHLNKNLGFLVTDAVNILR